MESAKAIASGQMQRVPRVLHFDLPLRNPAQPQLQVTQQIQCFVRRTLSRHSRHATRPGNLGRIHSEFFRQKDFGWALKPPSEQASGAGVRSGQIPAGPRLHKFVGANEGSRLQQAGKFRDSSSPDFRSLQPLCPAHLKLQTFRGPVTKPTALIGALEGLIRTPDHRRGSCRTRGQNGFLPGQSGSIEEGEILVLRLQDPAVDAQHAHCRQQMLQWTNSAEPRAAQSGIR